MNNYHRNSHLNLFHFYGQHGKQYLEDNLTRGLAICFENDLILLDRFLREILQEDYSQMFKTEGESSELEINVQLEAKKFVGIQTVYGVPLTTQELSLDPDNDSKETENPITDLSIQIGDQLILIEVKRTAENCLKQLQNQIDKLIETSDGDVNQKYVETFSWNKLMDLVRHTLKFEGEVGSENLFTRDYYHFIKSQFPSWFPNIPFSDLEFPDDFGSKPKLKEHLEVRLNVIKQKMLAFYNEENGTEYELVYNRSNIPVPDYSWVDEINIEPVSNKETGEKFIALRIWPGDTKTQGFSIFKKDKKFNWPDYIHDQKYKFIVNPYIKFSHMQGLCWVWMKENLTPETHKKVFFDKFAGKWKRSKHGEWVKGKKGAWEEFDETIERINETQENWKKSSHFNEKITNSQRSYFNVSLGFAIEVRIPYHIVQEIDRGRETGASRMAKELYKVSKDLLDTLDQLFSA